MRNLPRSSLPGYLISFFFLFLLQLPSTYSGQFRVIGQDHPTQAFVGGLIELSCHLSPAKNATGMEIGWYRSPFSRVVHLYRNGKDQDAEQAPEYRDRTKLVKDAIGEGKVTLRIKHVRFSDEGGYTCFFRDHSYQEEAAMQLKVEDPYFLRVPCWKIALFVIVPVLGPLAAMIICYNWLHRRLAGQFLEELKYPF
uniref:Myelin oligodendrocyte glycoprotein n=1 Tax=Monodelphis domestica TaxID=13616 RepID=A0A5F8GD18_MONDO